MCEIALVLIVIVCKLRDAQNVEGSGIVSIDFAQGKDSSNILLNALNFLQRTQDKPFRNTKSWDA